MLVSLIAATIVSASARFQQIGASFGVTVKPDVRRT